MLLSKFNELSDALDREAKAIQKAKRPSYTAGSPDVLHNFKTVAERVGITPGQVLSVYLLKHVDAVVSALSKPHLPQAEAILGRFADNINYLHLGYAIVEEERAAQQVANPAPRPPAEPLSVGAYGYLPGEKTGA